MTGSSTGSVREKGSAPCESTCSKCGGADIVRDLKAKGETYDPSFGAHHWLGKPWIKEKSHWKEFARECIEHHCRDCHYEWCTEPLS